MPTARAVARAARAPVRRPRVLEDEDERAPFLTDASRFPGGVTPRVYLPASEGEVAWVVVHEERVLTVGAQSSLTGGGCPAGDAVLATARLDRIERVAPDRVRAGAGVPLVTLQEALAESGAFFRRRRRSTARSWAGSSAPTPPGPRPGSTGRRAGGSPG